MNTNKHHRTTIARAVARANGLLLAGLSVSALAGPTINLGKESYLEIDYSLQVWAQARGYTSSTNSDKSNEFFLRRNRLTFAGQYNDLVGFYAQLDAPSSGKGLDEESDKNVFFRDAYVTLDFSDATRFIVGRFKNTFTRENLEGCFEPLTMDRAEVMSYTPFGGSRDTGAAIWGNLFNGHFQYRGMIANGRDSANKPADNQRLTARVHWSVFDPEADYGYRGTYLGTKTVLTVGAAVDYQKDVAFSNLATRSAPQDYKAWTVDVFYEQPTASGTYTVSAAKIKYDTGDAINGPSPDPDLPVTSQLDGWYVKAGYLLPQKVGPGRLQFFGRYEDSNYNLFSGFRDQKWKGIGLNYYLDGQKLKVSVEYAKVTFDKPNPLDAAQQDYSQLTTGLQLLF